MFCGSPLVWRSTRNIACRTSGESSCRLLSGVRLWCLIACSLSARYKHTHVHGPEASNLRTSRSVEDGVAGRTEKFNGGRWTCNCSEISGSRHHHHHTTTPHHHTTTPPHHTTPRHATPRHATPRHTTRHATPRHATPRHATPRHATPRHATPRHATPRAAILFANVSKSLMR